MTGGFGYFNGEQEARIRAIVREEIGAGRVGPARAHFRQVLADLGFPVVDDADDRGGAVQWTAT